MFELSAGALSLFAYCVCDVVFVVCVVVLSLCVCVFLLACLLAGWLVCLFD